MYQSRPLMILACAGVAGLVASCPHDPEPVHAPTGEDFIRSMCAFSAPCCAMAGLADGVMFCRNFFGLVATRSSYDVTAGEACLTAMREESVKPQFCEDITGPPVCARVFQPNQPRGNQQPGQSCASSRECAPAAEGESRCINPQGGPAWCQVQIRGTAGDGPCVATVGRKYETWYNDSQGEKILRGYLCDETEGLYCDGVDRHCARKKPLGQPCSSTEQCETTDFCDINERTCLARKPVGAACLPSQVCVDPAFCNSTRTCSVGLPTGSRCSNPDDCRSGTCETGKCGPTLDPSVGLLCGNALGR
jgi:hypothetical protein